MAMSNRIKRNIEADKFRPLTNGEFWKWNKHWRAKIEALEEDIVRLDEKIDSYLKSDKSRESE